MLNKNYQLFKKFTYYSFEYRLQNVGNNYSILAPILPNGLSSWKAVGLLYIWSIIIIIALHPLSEKRENWADNQNQSLKELPPIRPPFLF